MPRRSSFRRRYFRRRRSSVYGRYKRTRTLGRMMRRIAYSIPEKKYFEFICCVSSASAVSTPSNSAWQSIPGNLFLSNDFDNQITLLGAIQQGVSENERIGNRIHVKYIQIGLVFQFNNNNIAAANPSPGSNMYGMFCRYCVFEDNQPNGESLPLANLWQDWGNTIGSGGSASAVPFDGARTFAFRDFNSLRQFRVKLDMQHKMHNTANTTAAASTSDPAPTTGIQIVQHYIPVNKTVTYTAVATPNDILTSHSKMKDHDYILNVIPSGTNCCQCYASVRVCFTDA